MALEGHDRTVRRRPVCQAGRSASFGGRWQDPCPDPVRHLIASPDAGPIALCDIHFRQVNDANLVTKPNIDRLEYARREVQRHNGAVTRRWRRLFRRS